MPAFEARHAVAAAPSVVRALGSTPSGSGAWEPTSDGSQPIISTSGSRLVDIWMFPKIGVPPNHPISNRVFHYKPSILGYHYFRKHPYVHGNSCELEIKLVLHVLTKKSIGLELE